MTCVDDEIVHRQSQLSQSVHCSSFDMTTRPREGPQALRPRRCAREPRTRKRLRLVTA